MRTSKDKVAADPFTKSIDELAALLTRAGGKPVTAAMIKADLKAGAPKAKGGGVHWLNYAAWLAKELAVEAARPA